jgi:L-seryl-tRNA(Ser) seleniumtransferase
MTAANPAAQDPYLKLGVRPFIHCAGVRTIHGGSLMLPEVSRAMELAARRFVNIDELMAAASKRIAELTGAEAGIITSGCAAALCHATAAALTGADPERMLRLPDTSGLQAKVVMPSTGRFTYDHAIRMTGARIVEVDSVERLVEELDDGAALVALLAAADEKGAVTLEQIAPIARKRGVPVLVDAAAEIPRVPNPFLSRGASMVAYSGGKYLRGPQCAGLLLGEARWIGAAWMHSAPHHGFGRPMKVGKEEIIGMLTALEVWAAQRRLESEAAMWNADLNEIAGRVGRLPSVSTRRLSPANSTDIIPKLEISWSYAELPILAAEVRLALLEGTPRIMLDDRGSSETSLQILPFSLQPGEATVVGDAIHNALFGSKQVKRAEAGAGNAAPIDISGRWTLDITFVVGSARHRLDIELHGERMAGMHRTLHLANPIKGSARGDQVDFSSLHKFEGTNLAYRFVGRVSAGGDAMSGTVELGSTGQAAPGPLNMKEYGNATWQAKRQVS